MYVNPEYDFSAQQAIDGDTTGSEGGLKYSSFAKLLSRDNLLMYEIWIKLQF